jgi:4-amino-4-deoxy-L-arabinose transferase-like glycosyltransferase
LRPGSQRTGWLVFAVALAVRLAFVATLDERLVWPDERDFVSIGRRLAAGEGFVASSYRSAPVLPVYLGVAFRLFGDGYRVPRIGQALLGAITCVVVMATATLLVSPAVGVLSGALLAVYPPAVYVAGMFYTTCLETFCCAACVWLAARVLRGRGGIGSAALCGVALGLAVLTRPVFLVVAPCVVAVWCLGGRSVATAGALLLGVAITVLPWSVRNEAVFGRFMLVSSGGGITLWKGNNELADGGADDRFLGWGREGWNARLAQMPPAEREAIAAKYARIQERVQARERETGEHYLAMDDVLGPVAREYIRAEPGRALVRSLRKVATFFSAYSRTVTAAVPGWGAWLAALTFYPVLALAACGAPFGVGRGLALPYLVVVAMTGAHALLTSCTRFRLPIDPYLIMGASFAVVELTTRVSSRCGVRK